MRWQAFTACAAQQRAMYDGWLAAIAERYPGGSLLDFGCMNGYFPVKAQLLGMGRVTGADGFCDRSRTDFLNALLGTSVEFVEARYDPRTHSAPIEGKWDVVCASAIMCHQPDPLNFLAFLGSLANDALFVFDQVVDTDRLLVEYWEPAGVFGLAPARFPLRFDRSTQLSRGMLHHAFTEMGFPHVIDLPFEQRDWLDHEISNAQRVPDYIRPEHHAAYRLGAELLAGGSMHAALLATRRPAR